jgi:hypothetical protein
MTNCCGILVGKHVRTRALRINLRKSRSDDTTKMNHAETECKGMEWIHMAQSISQWRTFKITEMNSGVPWKVDNFLANP